MNAFADKINEVIAFTKEMQLKGYWTRAEYRGQEILVDYGYVYTNGMHERAIATRVFYEDGKKVTFPHA